MPVAEVEPGACNSTEEEVPDGYCPMEFLDVCSTCATEPAQERRFAYPMMNLNVVEADY